MEVRYTEVRYIVVPLRFKFIRPQRPVEFCLVLLAHTKSN